MCNQNEKLIPKNIDKNEMNSIETKVWEILLLIVEDCSFSFKSLKHPLKLCLRFELKSSKNRFDCSFNIRIHFKFCMNKMYENNDQLKLAIFGAMTTNEI